MRPILPILLLAAAPANAEVLDLKEGDVYCVAYDEKTETCASVLTLKDLGNGNYFSIELGGFALGETRLDMVVAMASTVIDGQICTNPDGVEISISSKKSKLAEGWQNLMQHQYNTMVGEGFCFEYKKCDDQWLAAVFVGGKERGELSAVFRVFEADDPRSKTVQPRYLNELELTEMAKQSDRCIPTDI